MGLHFLSLQKTGSKREFHLVFLTLRRRDSTQYVWYRRKGVSVFIFDLTNQIGTGRKDRSSTGISVRDWRGINYHPVVWD